MLPEIESQVEQYINALITAAKNGGHDAIKALLEGNKTYNSLSDNDKLSLVQQATNKVGFQVAIFLIERLEISPELHEMISAYLKNFDNKFRTHLYNFRFVTILLEHIDNKMVFECFPILRNYFDGIRFYDDHGNTLFTDAAMRNDLERVKRIYAFDPSQLTKKNMVNHNALQEAIESQFPASETILWLFETMEHTQEEVEQLFLTLSRNSRQLDALTMLLEHPNSVIDQLLLKDYNNDSQFLRLLISSIIVSIQPHITQISDLQFHSPHLRALFALINRTIDLSSPSPIPNHMAARYYMADELVKFDIQASHQTAQSNALRLSKIGFCLFSKETQHRHQFQVSSIDEKNSKGLTALHHLMQNAPGTMINRLRQLQNEAPVQIYFVSHLINLILDMLNNNHNTVAAKNTLDRLLAYGALIDMPDNFGNTALHYAAAWHKEEFLVYFIQQGAPLNMRNNEGITPLMYACKRNESAEILALLDRGANPLITDNNGKDAIFYLNLNDLMPLNVQTHMRELIQDRMDAAHQFRM